MSRLSRAFLAARAALGLALVFAQLIALQLGSPAPHWTIALCLAYAIQALAQWLWSRRDAEAQLPVRVASPLWWASIGLDLAVFGLLMALDHGVNYGAMLVLPVLMAGVLAPRLQGLATAAAATLLMLVVAGWDVLQGADVGLRMTQAGLVGSGFFVVSLLASEMASRLAREVHAARDSMEIAHQQAELNRLVIAEMQEGVLVVDRGGSVRAANPAAISLLDEPGSSRATPFQLLGVSRWQALMLAVEQAFAGGSWPAAGRDLSIDLPGGVQRSLRLRLRFTRRQEANLTEDLCVLLLEDKRQVLARSQQEKLAAMGRISAGIAHEIRNPLAAIAQANALLAEDSGEARGRQLTGIVEFNVQRLKRIVDDVMAVAPSQAPASLPVEAGKLVGEICRDWARTNQLGYGPDAAVSCTLPQQPLLVAFDAEHLRRVLVNLLDNALRHAGQVQVELAAGPAGKGEPSVRLAVFSAGAPMPPEVEQHLFEPFFSTRSRGNGLGLFICRELCERYDARIECKRRSVPLPGNEFTVWLRRLEFPTPMSRR